MLVAILVTIVIGGIIGWLASLIVKGRGLGLAGDIVVGIVGSVLGGWLLPRLGLVAGRGAWAERSSPASSVRSSSC